LKREILVLCSISVGSFSQLLKHEELVSLFSSVVTFDYSMPPHLLWFLSLAVVSSSLSLVAPTVDSWSLSGTPVII